MTGFLLKKIFFDLWDNMLRVVILNLGFIVIAGVGVYLPYVFQFNNTLAFLAAAFSLFLFNFYAGGVSFMAGDMADYRSPGAKEFFEYLKGAWAASLLLTGITVLQIAVFLVAFPFYSGIGGVFGLGALSILFWISVIWWLSAQYFFPVRTRLDKDLKKILKKSFILFFDNPVFSIFIGVGTVALLLLSSFTAFLIPGITGLLLFHQGAVKLRLLKYDYLESESNAPGDGFPQNRKKIPWEALLLEERERIGPRSLKGMIFPWKE